MPPRASTTSTSTSSTAQPCKPITRLSLPPKAIIGREGQGPRRARRFGFFSLFFDQLVGPARAIAAARGFNRSWRREGVLWLVSEGPPFASEQVRTHDHGLPRRWRQGGRVRWRPTHLSQNQSGAANRSRADRLRVPADTESRDVRPISDGNGRRRRRATRSWRRAGRSPLWLLSTPFRTARASLAGCRCWIVRRAAASPRVPLGRHCGSND